MVILGQKEETLVKEMFIHSRSCSETPRCVIIDASLARNELDVDHKPSHGLVSEGAELPNRIDIPLDICCR